MDPVESASLELAVTDLARLAPILVPADGEATASELSQRLSALGRHACRDSLRQIIARDSRARDWRRMAAAIADTETQLRNSIAALDYPSALSLSAQRESELQAQQDLSHSRLADYRRSMHRQLPRLAQEIEQAGQDYQNAERRLRDFFGSTKGLWDLEAGQWRGIDWGNLDQAAALAAEWPQIQELARRLGRRWSSQLPPSPSPSANKIEYRQRGEHRLEEMGRSEIIGLTQGSDLSLLPAGEILLLADPEAESVFYKRHAEGALVNLEYITQADRERRFLEGQSVPDTPPAPEQGPVIVCVDTSGSMAGWAERVAKALSLALVRVCGENRRGVYIVAFSTAIQCLDLSDPVAALPQLLDFMAHSFHGGTDLRPALQRSLELLDNPAWTNADLLIVSDFRVPKLMIKKSAAINPIRTRHAARLHALSIAAAPPVDDLHIFDSHWHFRLDRHGQAQGIDPSQFKEIQ